jgi:transmembrane sensor
VQTDRTFSTPLGGRETVSFADGSKIELNTNTILRARMTTGERIVWLDRGEAYFQVRHDAAHPFTVIAGNRRITDLGTKFLVRQDVSGLEVALLEGKIRFGSSDGAAHAAILAPGEVARVSGNALSIAPAPMQTLTDELSWRRGALVFKYRTLADVASEFNRYNAKKIIIADAVVGNLLIFGTFRTQDVDRFTRVTQKALGLNVRDEGDQIVISR